MDSTGTMTGEAQGAARRPADTHLQAAMKGRWHVRCRDKHGAIKWEDTIGPIATCEEDEPYSGNIVVNVGLDYMLDAGLSGGTPVTTWYLGLLSASPTVAAGNTMASHAGWTEVTAYDEANRVTWTDGGVSSQSVSNSGSPADFTISTNGTDIGGAFLTSNNTKGGTTGTLYAAGAFTAGDKSLDDNDSIEVTFTATAAAA
jgi:hypothetical protein